MDTLIYLDIAAIVVISAWILRHLPDADEDAQRWQQTTRDAAAAEDPAEAEAQREIAELEAWFKARPRPRNAIPHQTRRTEEAQ